MNGNYIDFYIALNYITELIMNSFNSKININFTLYNGIEISLKGLINQKQLKQKGHL